MRMLLLSRSLEKPRSISKTPSLRLSAPPYQMRSRRPPGPGSARDHLPGARDLRHSELSRHRNAENRQRQMGRIEKLYQQLHAHACQLRQTRSGVQYRRPPTLRRTRNGKPKRKRPSNQRLYAGLYESLFQSWRTNLRQLQSLFRSEASHLHALSWRTGQLGRSPTCPSRSSSSSY